MFKKRSAEVGEKRKKRPFLAKIDSESGDEELAGVESMVAVKNKRLHKGLAASELMKPVGPKQGQSYISQNFSSGTRTKKDEMEDRLVGLISASERELLAQAERN